MFVSLFGPAPHSGAFDINADEVFIGITLCQGYGVFAFAATELKNDRVVVAEHGVPFTRKLLLLEQGQLTKIFLCYVFCRALIDVRQCPHLSKLL